MIWPQLQQFHRTRELRLIAWQLGEAYGIRTRLKKMASELWVGVTGQRQLCKSAVVALE